MADVGKAPQGPQQNAMNRGANLRRGKTVAKLVDQNGNQQYGSQEEEVQEDKPLARRQGTKEKLKNQYGGQQHCKQSTGTLSSSKFVLRGPDAGGGPTAMISRCQN